MTTDSSSPKQDNSRQKLIAIAAVIIVALLGVNAFLIVNSMNKSKANKELTSQLDESEQLKAELEKQYYEALSELEEMRGSNEELNALIEQQKEELKSQKDRIDGLIAKEGQLTKARREMNRLNAKVEQYLAEINQLRAENEQMAGEIEGLNTEKAALSSDLENQRQNYNDLSTAQAALVNEKDAIEAERNQLSKKVDIASVIKVEGIEVTGYKQRKSGRLTKKRYAKNIDQLKICFNASENNVTDAGVEEFLIRIISPGGQTLAVEGLGSGVFTNESNGDQIRYTQAKETDYSNSAETLCANWTPGQAFAEGNYTVEVYNKGYLAGTSTFRLK